MNCPYCSTEMIDGNIYGDRYQLKWLPKTQKLKWGIWATNSLKLGTTSLGGNRPRIASSLCQSCQKMVIDLKETNSINTPG